MGGASAAKQDTVLDTMTFAPKMMDTMLAKQQADIEKERLSIAQGYALLKQQEIESRLKAAMVSAFFAFGFATNSPPGF